MLIIPAIDIIDGKCVRLTKGDYATQKIYSTNPVSIALHFEDAGIKYLHLVDLDGAKKGEVVNWKVLESIASQTALKIDFSGGIKTLEIAQRVFETGATQITIGSLAVKNTQELVSWFTEIHSSAIILGADVIGENIAIHGWQERSDKDIFSFLEFYTQHNIQYIMCTDVSKDGMMEGPSFGLYKKLMVAFPDIKLIASGGVTSIDDLIRLQDMGCYGAIIGKALYEERISLQEIKKYFLF